MKWPVAIAFVLVAGGSPPLLLRAFTPDPAHEDRGRRWDDRHRLEPMASAELPGRYLTSSPLDELVLHEDGTYVLRDRRPSDAIDGDLREFRYCTGFPDTDTSGSWSVRASVVQLRSESGGGSELPFGLLEGVPALVGNTDTWRRAR